MNTLESTFVETEKILTDLGLSNEEAAIASVISARIAMAAHTAMAPYYSKIQPGRSMLLLQTALAITMKLAAFTETETNPSPDRNLP